MISRLALGATLLTVTAFTETPTAPVVQAVGPVTHVITQKNKQFYPADVVVGIGDSLSFINDDLVTHNVFSRTDGFAFNLKLQSPGKVHAVPFAAPGTAEVRCAFHPTMKLKVVIR